MWLWSADSKASPNDLRSERQRWETELPQVSRVQPYIPDKFWGMFHQTSFPLYKNEKGSFSNS